MRLISLPGTLIALVMLLLSCGGPESPEQTQLPAGKVTVSPASRLVTMEVKDALVTAVLAELGQQAHITVTIPDNMRSERVTLAFQDLSLEDALRRVLGGQSYTVLYEKNGGLDVISGVRLFAKPEQVPPADTPSSNVQASVQPHASQSPPTLPPPTGSWARLDSTVSEAAIPAYGEDTPLDDLKRSFPQAQDPAIRSAMLQAMTDRGEEGPVAPILTQALSDPDEGVQETALNLLKSSFDPVPIGPLASMATQDQNPDFRSEAMSLMTDQLLMEDRTKEEWAAVTAALNRGLSDPDANVREQAALLLPELSQVDQPTSKWGIPR